MPRHSRDAGLAAIAMQLATLRWNTELTTDEKDCVINSPGRNVYYMPDGITRVIRVYLGGCVRTLGVSRNPASAARFADLVLSRFWKYRQRGCRPPGPGELNFSTARLSADLQHEGPALALLDKLEQYLKANAALVEKTALPPRKTRSRIAEFGAQLETLRAEVEHLRQAGLEMGRRLVALETGVTVFDCNKKPAPSLDAGVTVYEANNGAD